MQKNILPLFLISACHFLLNAQKPMVLIAHYQPSDFLKDSFLVQIRQPVHKGAFGDFYYPAKILSFSKKGNNYTTVAQYDIPDTACSIFSFGFGHEIIVIPGDTMEMAINPNMSDKINGLYPSPWMNEFSYLGRNKFIYSLFDSLAYVAGELKWSQALLPDTKAALDSFYNEVTGIYTKRLDFLKNYSDRHCIQKRISDMAEAEISAAYFMNLVRPVGTKNFKKSSFPPMFINTLDKANFNDSEMFFKTVLYQPAAYATLLYHNVKEEISSLFTDKGLVSVYNYTKQSYIGEMRDNLVTALLSDFLGAPDIFPSFDSIVNDLKLLSLSESNVSYILLSEKKKKESVKKASMKEALLSSISDSSGKKMVLKEIFKGRPVVIDCWATWCIPCMKQMPFSIAQEKKYKSKVDFVYLSFDKFFLQWKNKRKELGIKGNYFILQKNFTSDFANYFKISSIPRYLVFDKAGRLIDNNAPRPSEDRFALLLDKLISK